MTSRLHTRTATFVILALTAGPSTGATQEGPPGPVSPDSAAVLREAIERPPAEHPVTVGQVVAFPLRLAALPLSLAFDGLAEGIGFLATAERYRGLVGFYRTLERARVRPTLSTELSPRSEMGLSVEYVGLRPLVVETGAAVRGSQRHGARLVLPTGWGHLELGGAFRRHADQRLWEPGLAGDPEQRAGFRWDQVGGGAALTIRSPPTFRIRALAGWQENDATLDLDETPPDPALDFDPGALFGATRDTRYLLLGLDAGVDLTRFAGLQIRGLRAGIEARRYEGVQDTPSDFTRLAIWAHGFVPVNSRQHFAARARLETSRGSGEGVPFTHLPALGGSETLRAYEWGRFRDRDLVAVTAEWRWEIWRDLRERGRVEACVFWEEGGVARRLDELDGTLSSYGLGFILAWSQRIAATTWVAFGEEGTRVSASLSAPFRTLAGVGVEP
ncbi:MAG: BamA/TamA family outer membrane protein [Gemmatimonadetes bacterium]|nr:BamA/TamA family outer membrane protein [Gemmatimonadota bacterium]NIR77419.1 BamA/TamA family outer membrane protein [Gemmatimonadota bacterium]NIT85940.1 BamA/TamA family outer membrane protein [Gemmatimonadota bacterium]NIU29760.1 BamA/TamA family outer membrane protein [Gemmatimonadota bacterium]NIU34793.1 BamA/TamA family outer membrane protein [Gemmatimonadota bacterium]